MVFIAMMLSEWVVFDRSQRALRWRFKVREVLFRPYMPVPTGLAGSDGQHFHIKRPAKFAGGPVVKLKWAKHEVSK